MLKFFVFRVIHHTFTCGRLSKAFLNCSDINSFSNSRQKCIQNYSGHQTTNESRDAV